MMTERRKVNHRDAMPGHQNFRWYDEETSTNIQFLMFLIFILYHLMPSGDYYFDFAPI